MGGSKFDEIEVKSCMRTLSATQEKLLSANRTSNRPINLRSLQSKWATCLSVNGMTMWSVDRVARRSIDLCSSFDGQLSNKRKFLTAPLINHLRSSNHCLLIRNQRKICQEHLLGSDYPPLYLSQIPLKFNVFEAFSQIFQSSNWVTMNRKGISQRLGIPTGIFWWL